MGPQKNGGRWLARIIGSFYLNKTGTDLGPQSSIATSVAFFSGGNCEFSISFLLIEAEVINNCLCKPRKDIPYKGIP